MNRKSRRTVHGVQQEYGVNYTETYTPLESWFTILTLVTLALLNKCNTRELGFVLAYPQALIEYDLFMKLQTILRIKGVNYKTHYSQMLDNIYDQKQSVRVWNM